MDQRGAEPEAAQGDAKASEGGRDAEAPADLRLSIEYSPTISPVGAVSSAGLASIISCVAEFGPERLDGADRLHSPGESATERVQRVLCTQKGDFPAMDTLTDAACATESVSSAISDADVGRALRSAYQAALAESVPAEMLALLAQLD